MVFSSMKLDVNEIPKQYSRQVYLTSLSFILYHKTLICIPLYKVLQVTGHLIKGTEKMEGYARSRNTTA